MINGQMCIGKVNVCVPHYPSLSPSHSVSHSPGLSNLQRKTHQNAFKQNLAKLQTIKKQQAIHVQENRVFTQM